ncbi:MAG: hypothetical protein EG825_13215 [Rhodocyclaceae bacterium]|nr:hypothetical protein [Rhodocyclaceae bacterium]
MGRNRALQAAAGIAAFINGYQKGSEISRERELRNDVAQADKDFTPRETPTASGEEAMAAGQQAMQNAMAGAANDEERARVEKDYAPTIAALEAQRQTPAGVVRSLGIGPAFRQQDQPFSQQEVIGAKAQAKADVYSRAGREDDASRVMLNAARATQLANETELRTAMTPTRNQSGLIAGAPTDMADATSHAQPTSATETPSPSATVAKRGFPLGRDPLDHYLKDVAPKAVQVLVKQGRVEEAKRYADFLESRDGLAYAKAYTTGLRQFAVGDHEGAMRSFESLYNLDMYPDGHRAKLTALDGGDMQIDQINAKGEVISTRRGKVADLSEQAALYLNPLKAVEFMAQQTGKRKAEEASYNKAIELERLRQDGQEVREDRRDERLAMRLSAGGGLTAPQQRSNAEIDAAREAVSGLSPEEIKRRTAKATNTGRENPDYDPGLARQVNLAGRRKVGADDFFDKRQQGQQAPPMQAPAFNRDDVATRFRADKSMNNYTLGNPTDRGIEVKDKTGKLVGYFQ